MNLEKDQENDVCNGLKNCANRKFDGAKSDCQSCMADAFSAIEQYDMKVNTIICSVCGHITMLNKKGSELCIHLKQDLKGFKNEL